MKQPPFHRRILPWVFVVAFIFMAPAVVFYTAGYRWNPKKGIIERNGTFIIDTSPRGAAIELNGKLLPDKTPITLQNTAPGTYTLKLSKDGYHDWSKVFFIEPERVTFATDIYLWPDEDPTFKISGNFENIYTDTDYKTVLLANTSTSTIELYSYDYSNSLYNAITTLESSESLNDLLWNDSGDEIILSTAAGNIFNINITNQSLSPLPQGYYHFEKNNLIGNSNDYRIEMESNGLLSRIDKPNNVIDSFDTFQIADIQGTSELVLMKSPDAEQGFVLPGGNWRFYDAQRDYVLFRDGRRWLWLQIEEEPYSFTMAEADFIYPIKFSRETIYLLHNNNEILTWSGNKEPELIYRQSEPIVAAAWHPEGMDIMMATKKEIIMIQLDDRSGRYKTVLANFDEIKDAVVFDSEILILGTLDGRTGVWSLVLNRDFLD